MTCSIGGNASSLRNVSVRTLVLSANYRATRAGLGDWMVLAPSALRVENCSWIAAFVEDIDIGIDLAAEQVAGVLEHMSEIRAIGGVVAAFVAAMIVACTGCMEGFDWTFPALDERRTHMRNLAVAGLVARVVYRLKSGRWVVGGKMDYSACKRPLLKRLMMLSCCSEKAKRKHQKLID